MTVGTGALHTTVLPRLVSLEHAVDAVAPAIPIPIPHRRRRTRTPRQGELHAPGRRQQRVVRRRAWCARLALRPRTTVPRSWHRPVCVKSEFRCPSAPRCHRERGVAALWLVKPMPPAGRWAGACCADTWFRLPAHCLRKPHSCSCAHRPAPTHMRCGATLCTRTSSHVQLAACLHQNSAPLRLRPGAG